MAHPWTGMRCPICNTTMQSNDDVRRITSDAINKHHITDHAQVAQGDYAHHKCIKKPEIHVARGEIEQLRARRRLLEAQIEQKTARIQQLQSEPRPRQYGLPSAPTSSSQHPAAASALPGQPSGQHPSIESYTNGIPEELKSNCDFVVPFSTAYAQTQQYFSSVPQTTTTTTSTTVVLRSARQQSYVQRLYDELLNVNNRINGMQRVYTAAEFHAQSSTSSTAPPPINTRGMSASIYDVPTTSREPSFPSMTTTTSFKETQASDHQPRKRKRSDDVTESDIMNVVDGMASLQTTTQHADTFARSQSTSHPPTYNRTELTATSAIQHRYATAAIARHIAVPGDPTSYSFHMPSVSLHDFTDEKFQADITTFARHLQSFHHSHQPPQQDEIMWEYTFSTVLDGFGATMPQLYPTSGIGVTILHDEMLDSSAFNYMTSPSEGAALWITVKMGDLRSFFSLTEINELMRLGCHPNKFHIGRTLDKFITGKIPMQFLIQQPGQLVYTPAATGAMHMVITYGTLVEKLTWNYTFTQHGAAYSIAQWQTSQPYNAFITDGNTTMANHAVLPLYTMQQRGYDFGLHRHMTQLAERVSVFMRTAPHGTTILRFTDIQPHTTSIMSSSGFCTHCFHRLDWLLIRRAGMEDACIHCFFQEQ